MTDHATAATLAEWGDTWFGSPDDWSLALVAAARRCLALSVPAALAWGPDFRLLYNQAYADLLEGLHPGVRGRPAWEATSAMWSVVGPMLQEVRTTGRTQRGERVALALDTPAGRRTHWYSWTYSPVRADDRVEGVLAVVRDDTAAELAAQHEQAIAVAARVATASDTTPVLRELVHALGNMPDVRFAIAHEWGPDRSWNRFAQAGPELLRPTAASLLDHAERSGRWPIDTTPPQRDDAAPAVVRSPAENSHGLWDSWSAVAAVRGHVVVLTVGIDPAVGEFGSHRSFVENLIQRIATHHP